MQGLAGILETEFAENLNKIPAAAILGSGEMVEVTTKRAKYTADQVIATVPLGVLKADHESLFTHLDEKKVNAINNLGNGCIGTLFLEWDQPWWSGNQAIFSGKSSIRVRTMKMVERRARDTEIANLSIHSYLKRTQEQISCCE